MTFVNLNQDIIYPGRMYRPLHQDGGRSRHRLRRALSDLPLYKEPLQRRLEDKRYASKVEELVLDRDVDGS
jgi:hypothetical protein